MTHVFGATHHDQKVRKSAFWADTGAIKASTIHSYKGWEARHIILGIDPLPDVDPEDSAERVAVLPLAEIPQLCSSKFPTLTVS